MRRYRVTNARSGRVLGSAVGDATTLGARLVGLLGRRSLKPGEGLRLDPCTSIHMFFMRFAIDAVFTDEDHRVVRTIPNLRPWRIAMGGRGARAVLELPVGTIERSETRAGDRLELLEVRDGR